MPISQATILAIYGDLVDLVEKIETLRMQAFEPDLFSDRWTRQEAVYKGIKHLRQVSHEIQKQAIEHILADEPGLAVNPITGRIDE
jgi:hypothetical protein